MEVKSSKKKTIKNLGQRKKSIGKLRVLSDEDKGGYSDPETLESGLYLRKTLYKK